MINDAIEDFFGPFGRQMYDAAVGCDSVFVRDLICNLVPLEIIDFGIHSLRDLHRNKPVPSDGEKAFFTCRKHDRAAIGRNAPGITDSTCHQCQKAPRVHIEFSLVQNETWIMGRILGQSGHTGEKLRLVDPECRHDKPACDIHGRRSADVKTHRIKDTYDPQDVDDPIPQSGAASHIDQRFAGR